MIKIGGGKMIKLAIATKFIKSGETMATINLGTGKVKSDNLKFLPNGKNITLDIIKLKISEMEYSKINKRFFPKDSDMGNVWNKEKK